MVDFLVRGKQKTLFFLRFPQSHLPKNPLIWTHEVLETPGKSKINSSRTKGFILPTSCLRSARLNPMSCPAPVSGIDLALHRRKTSTSLTLGRGTAEERGRGFSRPWRHNVPRSEPKPLRLVHIKSAVCS